MMLNQITVGQRAKVTGYREQDSLVLQRLVEMGLTRGTEVEILRFAPLGDPMEIIIRGYQLSVRRAEAALVEVEKL